MIYFNGTPVLPTIFPDKTSQVWKLNEISLDYALGAFVQWIFENESEFMHLAQLKDLLDHYRVPNIKLKIYYLPYARQDKEVSNTSTFALRTFAKHLNTLGFEEIIIVDPHSEVALDLIVKSKAVYPTKQVEEAAQSMSDAEVVLCYPDKGAVEKYSKVYKSLYRPHVYGEKVRDQLTGNIVSYKLIGNVKDKNVLIVDDICDGGMTFKLLAKDLLAAGAKEVNLFVTHGIFSKGLGTLFESGIKRVFTHDGEKGNSSQKVQL